MASGKRNISGLSYVALKAMNVNGTRRNRGDAVPEAANWKNLHNYVSAGFIGVVNEGAATDIRKNTKTKAAGGAGFTEYRPQAPDLTPASVPVDQTAP